MDEPSTSKAEARHRASVKRSYPYAENDQNDAKRSKIKPSTDIQEVEDVYVPIKSLHPDGECSSIRGKVIQATNWMTSQNQSTYLFFRMKDWSGEIGGTVFAPMDLDFNTNFKVGATITVHKPKVVTNKMQYQNDGLYHLKINRFTTVHIEPASSSSTNNRKLIRAVQASSVESETVDVIAIIKSVGEFQRNCMREIQIIDESEADIILTLWDNPAKNFVATPGSVIAASSVTIRMYNNTKMLRTRQFSELLFDPPIVETDRLKKWYSNFKPDVAIACTFVANKSYSAARDYTSQHKETTDDKSIESFTSIDDIKSKISAGSQKTIACLVTDSDEPPKEQTTRSGKGWMKLIRVADDMNNEIELSVWGTPVKTHEIPLYSVIIASNVTVREFNMNKKLTCLWANLQINPDIPEASKLRNLIDHYTARKKFENKPASGSSSDEDGVSQPIVFTPIRELKENGLRRRKYNILAIVIGRGPPKKLTTKAGNVLSSRSVVVTDDEESQIEMTIEGNEVYKQDVPLHCVVEVTNVIVRLNDEIKTLSCLWTFMQINPDNPRADKLKKFATTDKIISQNLFIPNVFETMNEIMERRKIESKCNIIGIVREVVPNGTKTFEFVEASWMRSIKLEDSDNNIVEMNVWSNESIESEIPLGSVMAAKDASVQDSDGHIRLSVSWKNVTIDPDLPAAERLKEVSERKVVPTQLSYDVDGENEFDDYTPIDVIIRRNEPGDRLNTIGLVVRVYPLEQFTMYFRPLYKKKCVLRGKKGFEIDLYISGIEPFDVPMHTVIIARDSTVHRSQDGKELLLICFSYSIDYNIDIPEAEGFENAAMNVSVQSGDPVAPDPNDFTGFKMIKREMPVAIPINIIGIVVDTFTRPRKYRKQTENRDDSGSKRQIQYIYTMRVMLRDKDGELIVLNIRKTSYFDNFVTVHSVIAVRDAFFRKCDDEKMLWCIRKNVEINPQVSQAKEFSGLVGMPFVRGFISFKTIARERSLVGCKMNVIGEVAEIVPAVIRYRQRRLSRVIELRLRNDNDINLRVLGVTDFDRCLGHKDAIAPHAIIAVKDALLRRCRANLSLQAFRSLVGPDPNIVKHHKISKSLRIVRIGRIHQKARVGESVGVLAVVTTTPKMIVRDTNEFVCQAGNHPVVEFSKLSYVKLIDESGEKINMIVSASIADKMKKNNDAILIIRSRNLKVREYQSRLELWCTFRNPLIDINPQTEDAKALLGWYKSFCKTKPSKSATTSVSNKDDSNLDSQNITEAMDVDSPDLFSD